MNAIVLERSNTWQIIYLIKLIKIIGGFYSMEKLNQMELFQKILKGTNYSGNSRPESLKGPRKLTKPSDKCFYKECDGSGINHWLDENHKDIGVICKCVNYKKKLRKFRSAGIPNDFMGKRLNDFDVDVYEMESSKEQAFFAKKAVTGYLEQYHEFHKMGKGFYFYSQTKGSGKSLLSLIVGNELIEKYKLDIVYITVVSMLAEMKNEINKGKGVYDLIEHYKNADVLILDDLGMEKVTEWSEEILTQIMDDRMNYKKPIIITSNIAIEELDEKYPGGRLKSRIERLSLPIRMPEESVRKILSKQENREMARMLFK